MATDVVMPRLSDSMEEGTVLKWLVQPGDEVGRGDPLVEIETDKANMTYESDTDGVLVEIVADEGDTLAIGEVIARIGDASEVKEGGKAEQPEEAAGDEEEEGAAAASAEDEAEHEQAEEEEAEEPARADADSAARAEAGGGETAAGDRGAATKERPAQADGNGRVKASPVARRMARELGVELAAIEGSGPGGRIVKADVQAAAEGDGAKVAPAPAEEPAREERPAPAPEPSRGEAGAKGEATIHELTRLQ